MALIAGDGFVLPGEGEPRFCVIKRYVLPGDRRVARLASRPAVDGKLARVRFLMAIGTHHGQAGIPDGRCFDVTFLARRGPVFALERKSGPAMVEGEVLPRRGLVAPFA